jgi:hypothetical protein
LIPFVGQRYNFTKTCLAPFDCGKKEGRKYMPNTILKVDTL